MYVANAFAVIKTDPDPEANAPVQSVKTAVNAAEMGAARRIAHVKNAHNLVVVHYAPDAEFVQNAEYANARNATTPDASAKNAHTVISAEYAIPAHVRYVRIRNPADVPGKYVQNAISAQCAAVVNVARSPDREVPVSVPAKNAKTPGAMSVMFAATVTTAIYPHVQEVYVKTAKNVPEMAVQRGRASAKDLHVEETSARSAKSVNYAVNAGAVTRPARAPEANAPELSVLIAESAAFAIKPAVAQVHVDAIHPVATIVLVPTRYVSVINAMTERVPVHRTMAPTLEPSE